MSLASGDVGAGKTDRTGPLGPFARRRLGRTGLSVSPLGIGGGSQISSRDLLYAFDRGVNYFFFSSDLHHFAYRSSVDAIRELCGSGSTRREQVVLTTVSYVNDPEKIIGVLYDQFTELGVDYIDIFQWGWVTERSDCRALFEAAGQLKTEGALAKQLRFIIQDRERLREVNQELLERGLVRHVGASFHSRGLARQWMPKLDVLMLRYNLSHPGVETDIFPYLSGDKERDPGIVAFNTAHEGIFFFHQRPAWCPDGPIPSVGDCYRFALSNAHVDLVLTGVKDRAELDAALAAIEKGPLSPEEMATFRRYGLALSQHARLPNFQAGATKQTGLPRPTT
jgi:aryl-alcohol dehydrogenase-like predicted oxidoreductase